MVSIEKKIKSILSSDYDVHHIFKELVSKKSIFTEKEEIIDLIFIKREHLDERNRDSKITNKARLLIATSHGIVYAEEGFEEISDDYLGYRIKHIYYDKISSFELDICLLDGKFKIVTTSSEFPEIAISFNAANYFKQFEHFIDSVRKQRLKYKENF
jgi:hypothetical protein